VFMRKSPINRSNRFQILRASCNTILTQVSGSKISQKPFQLYEQIEATVNGGPRLELFARKHNQREGWLSIGDEAIQYKKKPTINTDNSNPPPNSKEGD
jgi:N6-adenosine-specific RNA methylase IME4